MSRCIPGMPCYDVLIKTTYSNDCDPCANFVFDAEKVEYTGPNLPCTGINTCDTLETALQKIDDKICSEDLVAQILQAIKDDETLLFTFCNMVATCVSNMTTSTTTTIA